MIIARAGDFDIWRSNNPDFDPFSLPMVQVQIAHTRICLTRVE